LTKRASGESGGYFRNPEEVIAHALQLLEEPEMWLQENRDQISRKIARNFAEIEQGKGV